MANIKENKRFHFTYKTTNLINGRYYLGMHSTNRIDDGYLGSGKRLYYELSKYGRNNFKFEILEQFNSREQLVQAEINLITEQDVKNSNCLNLKSGGEGGFTLEQTRNGGKISGAKHAERMKNDPEFKKRISEGVSRRSRERLLQDKENYPLIKYRASWAGKKHSQESIEKMKEVKKSHGIGVGNSQYGTCWITNEIQNRKIFKGDLIPEGWRLGRKLK